MKNGTKFSNAFVAGMTAVAVASTLVGCGGGGGGSVTTPAPAPIVATPDPTPVSTLATSVPTPTYAVGSVEKSLFDQLNSIRLNGGFGMLSQDVVLDAAAQSHANYVKTNYTTPWPSGGFILTQAIYVFDTAAGWLTAHVQKPGTPGFTGITPVDRIAAAGAKYTYAGEVMAFTTQSNCLAAELNTIFHRSPMLSTKNVSIGMGFVDLGLGSYGICVFEPGFKTTPNSAPAGWVGVYPADKQLGVPTGMPAGEAPDPAPEIPNALKGSPISIYFGNEIKTVEAFTVTAVGASSAVPVKLILKENFPTYLSASEAHILGKQPLSGATTYNVFFKGTLVTGKEVEKRWTFSTQ